MHLVAAWPSEVASARRVTGIRGAVDRQIRSVETRATGP